MTGAGSSSGSQPVSPPPNAAVRVGRLEVPEQAKERVVFTHLAPVEVPFASRLLTVGPKGWDVRRRLVSVAAAR
jgi:hypothetical protein